MNLAFCVFYEKGHTAPLGYVGMGFVPPKNTARLMLYAKFIPHISRSALSLPMVLMKMPSIKRVM